MTQNGYKDLIAWQKGMELVTAIYDPTDRFPSNKQFGLVSQLRRAAVSVPSNIAEGKCSLLQSRFRKIPPPRPRITCRNRNSGSHCAPA